MVLIRHLTLKWVALVALKELLRREINMFHIRRPQILNCAKWKCIGKTQNNFHAKISKILKAYFIYHYRCDNVKGCIFIQTSTNYKVEGNP